jgi:hypothetical protein
MEQQKQAIVELVASHRAQGRTVGEVLGSAGVARSSYYRWKKENGEKKAERPSSYKLTVEERGLIDEIKGQYPEYRHRRVQGMLQQHGVYLSASVIYGHLKAQGADRTVRAAGSAVEEPTLRGVAEKSDVG